MNEKYMKEAIKQAKKAASIGEVPIGCVIVYKDKIIGRGYNRRMTDHSVLAHAEIIAVIDIVERPAIGVGRIIPPPSRTVLLPGIAADSSAVIDGFRFEKAVGSRPLLG